MVISRQYFFANEIITTANFYFSTTAGTIALEEKGF
jgi:hypothetical protein